MGAPRGFSLDEIISGKTGPAPTATAPAQEGRTLDQILAAPEPERKAWENVGGDEPGGEVKNLKTSATKGVLSYAGTIGDMEHLASQIYAGIRSIPALWNKDAPDTKTIMARDKAAAEQKKTDTVEKLRTGEKPWWVGQGTWDRMQETIRKTGKLPTPVSNVATTEGLYKHYVEPYVGEYKPTTPEGRIGSATVQAGAGILAPKGKAQAAETILQKAPFVSSSGLRQTEKLTNPIADILNFRAGAISGLGGAGSAGVAEYTDNPNLPLIFGLAGPAAAEATIRGGARYIGPQTREGQARKAAGQMAEDIKQSDAGPNAVGRAYERGRETYDNLPEWQQQNKAARPNIAEATGSTGLAIDELVAHADPGAGPALKRQKEARDAAHENVLKQQADQALTGNEVKTGLTERGQQLEEQINKALPEVGSADALGTKGRGIIKQARGVAEDLRTRLYDYLETKFGNNVLLVPGLKQKAAELMQHTEGFETPKSTNASIELALKMNNEVSFSHLRVYLKDLNKKIDDLRGVPGMGTEKARLEALRAAVWDDMHNSVRNWEARAQEQGTGPGMGHNSDPAMVAAWEQKRDQWLAEQQGKPGEVTPPTGPKMPMTDEAVAALKDANAAQTKLGQTFREGVVGDLLKENRFAEAWNVKDSTVPRKVFPGGPDGYGITKAVLEAGGPQMHEVVKQSAVMSLRETMAKAGGTLTPQGLQKWLNDNGKSLAAIDEAEVAAGRPKFSEQFNNIANAQSKLASDFIGAVDIQTAQKIVGNMLSSKAGGPAQFAKLIAEAGNQGPLVQEGLKKLVIDSIIGDARGALGLKGDFAQRMNTALQENKPVLRQLFGDQHLQVMESLIQDAKSQRQHADRLAPGVANSDTARRTKIIQQRMADVPALTARDVVTGLVGGGGLGPGLMWLSGMERSPGMGMVAAAGAAGSLIVSRLKSRGINGTNDALRAGLIDPDLGMRMLQFANETQGSPKWWQSFDTAIRMSPYFVPVTQQAGRNELDIDKKARQGRAAGGRTTFKLDCASKASKLCHEAELIRKKHAGETKKYLSVPDDVVADALRVAGGRL